VVSKIMLALELLSDGKWHGTEELLLKLELNEHKLQEITTFLGNYGFVEIDEENRKVRINKDFQKLVAQSMT
jgi:DNA-binding IclR family transcriptional regulator